MTLVEGASNRWSHEKIPLKEGNPSKLTAHYICKRLGERQRDRNLGQAEKGKKKKRLESGANKTCDQARTKKEGGKKKYK